jgi:hypothetical protein
MQYIRANNSSLTTQEEWILVMMQLNKSPYGENWHPSNATQKAMADAITPYVKTLMNW